MSVITRIHGLECDDVTEVDGVSTEDGGRDSDNYTLAGRDYGTIADKGRKPRTWKIKSRFLTKADMEEWLNEVRTAPEGAECYPLDSDRSIYMAQADARALKAQLAGSSWVYPGRSEDNGTGEPAIWAYPGTSIPTERHPSISQRSAHQQWL